MMIYVFQRPDGSTWAEYSEAVAKRNKVLEQLEAHTRSDYEKLLGHRLPRVRALAERGLKEFLARNQQPEPAVSWTPTLVTLKERGFWGRAKWLLTGK